MALLEASPTVPVIISEPFLLPAELAPSNMPVSTNGLAIGLSEGDEITEAPALSRKLWAEPEDATVWPR